MSCTCTIIMLHTTRVRYITHKHVGRVTKSAVNFCRTKVGVCSWRGHPGVVMNWIHTLSCITLHALSCTTLQYRALHYIALKYPVPTCTALHCAQLPYTVLHYPARPPTNLHCPALHFPALLYITLHYPPCTAHLQDPALSCTTLYYGVPGGGLVRRGDELDPHRSLLLGAARKMGRGVSSMLVVFSYCVHNCRAVLCSQVGWRFGRLLVAQDRPIRSEGKTVGR